MTSILFNLSGKIDKAIRGEYEWWRQKTHDHLKAQWGGEVAAGKRHDE